MSSNLALSELKEKRLSSQKNLRPYGYIYETDQGNKVLVVVDDSIDVLDSRQVINAHQTGLLEILQQCNLVENIRAVGFFMLPKPSDLTDCEFIRTEIQTWLERFENCNCYMLVDYFYGEGFDYAQNSGEHFVKYWLSRHPNLLRKLAFLSLGGRPNVHQPVLDDEVEQIGDFSKSRVADFEVFRKTEFEDHGFLPKHREWLELNEHVLEALWRQSHNWFMNDDDDDDTGAPFYMKHNPGSVCQYFFGESNNPKQKNGYRRCLVDVFGFKFPNDWWEKQETITAVHESLKHLCGVHFCGQASTGEFQDLSRRHISTGSAFLLAMMAHYQVHRTMGVFGELDIWDGVVHMHSPIFPLQDQVIARQSTILLYECFCRLFENKYGANAQSPVESVYFEREGKKLVIQLEWKAYQQNPRDERSLAESFQSLVLEQDSKSQSLPQKERQSKTRFAVLDLQRYLSISDTGFGAPGTLFMDGNRLIIASTL